MELKTERLGSVFFYNSTILCLFGSISILTASSCPLVNLSNDACKSSNVVMSSIYFSKLILFLASKSITASNSSLLYAIDPLIFISFITPATNGILTLLSEIPTNIKFPFGFVNIIPDVNAAELPQQSHTISNPLLFVLAYNFSISFGSNALKYSSAAPSLTDFLPLNSFVSVSAT